MTLVTYDVLVCLYSVVKVQKKVDSFLLCSSKVELWYFDALLHFQFLFYKDESSLSAVLENIYSAATVRLHASVRTLVHLTRKLAL